MARNAETLLPQEWMIVTAAREIRDGEALMVGTQWPIPVALLAKRLHAPRSVLCLEGGMILEDLPERTPLWTGDPGLAAASSLMGNCLSTLGAVLHRGRADRAVLTAAHVDRFGNLNTTCVGPYHKPRMRFGGSGGACDFGSLARRTLVVVEQNRVRFPARLDFVTTPGPGRSRGGQVRTMGDEDPRPRSATVVTTMGRFHCIAGEELTLTGFRSDTGPEEIKKHVQWSLRVDTDCAPLPEPTRRELDILRSEIDPLGLYIHGRKQNPLAGGAAGENTKVTECSSFPNTRSSYLRGHGKRENPDRRR